MRHESFAAGAIILKDGDPTNDLLIVREGTVAVYVTKDDKKIEITRLGPMSYFGEMSVFDEYPRSANVEAVTDVVACRIERDTFRKLRALQSGGAVPDVHRIQPSPSQHEFGSDTAIATSQ